MRVLFALLFVACGGSSSGPPPDRCGSTMTSLQALEPTCWAHADAGAD